LLPSGIRRSIFVQLLVNISDISFTHGIMEAKGSCMMSEFHTSWSLQLEMISNLKIVVYKVKVLLLPIMSQEVSLQSYINYDLDCIAEWHCTGSANWSHVNMMSLKCKDVLTINFQKTKGRNLNTNPRKISF
jgi:hypothetical protein